MGGRDGGQGFGGSMGNAGASPLSFVLFFWFGLFLMLVVCVHACVFIPLTLLRVCLDTRLPGESRDDAARGDALVSKSDCLVVDEQSGR